MRGGVGEPRRAKRGAAAVSALRRAAGARERRHRRRRTHIGTAKCHLKSILRFDRGCGGDTRSGIVGEKPTEPALGRVHRLTITRPVRLDVSLRATALRSESAIGVRDAERQRDLQHCRQKADKTAPTLPSRHAEAYRAALARASAALIAAATAMARAAATYEAVLVEQGLPADFVGPVVLSGARTTGRRLTMDGD
jgi:hypothetical protein